MTKQQKTGDMIARGKLGHEFRKLDASTEEEVDALHVDLFQEDERPSARDGSGWVVDEVAEAEVARFTEVGRLQEERGAESLVPGRDNTSTILERHYPKSEVARRAEDAGNLDEPQDEMRIERKVDEGTAA
ncbi:MAG TPA: hypothetical protein VL967_01080 [Terracidiphilus sp.]|nr:hypothetical protein [Terracidiphilus sp.]